MKTYALATLGCKVNQYDGAAIRSRLGGWRSVDFGEPADFYIINACGVTGEAEAKARQLIRRAKRAAPKGQVVMTGCFPADDKRRLSDIGVDLFVSHDERAELPEKLLSLNSSEERPAGGEAAPMIALGRARAFVKVQDGCDQHCSYCAIPRFRGPLWSRPALDVVEEIGRLSAHGFSEVVLVGINLGKYGWEGDGPLNLAGLINTVLERTSIERLRLSSIEAGEVSDEILALVSSEPRVAPHLHIPLQSGSDAVLAAMNRPYRAADFLALVERARAASPDIGLTTDIMVGFPGEDEADFHRTLDAVRAAAFSRLHVFRFSSRPGTPAAQMAAAVAPETSKRRAAETARQGAESAAAFARRFVGRSVQAILEPEGDRGQAGLTGEYVRIEFDRAIGSASKLIAAEAGGSRGAILLGRKT